MTSGASQSALLEQLATRLFAALGYDSTSTSQIADAAGLNVAQVCALVGGKRDLYLTVMERLHQAEREVTERAIATSGDGVVQSANTLHRVADNYLDFCLDNPHAAGLWMHRWLLDARDVDDLERKYVLRQYQLVKSGLALAVDTGYVGEDVDVPFLVWSIIWSIHGFCQGGILDREGNLKNVHNPRTVRRFRLYLHRMIHRTMALPGDPP